MVLVVCPIQKINIQICNNLTRHGYDVLVCKNSEDALNIIKNSSISLIFFDVDTQPISISKFCTVVRKTTLTPIILLTTPTRCEQALNSIFKGADDFILKPFHIEEIICRVKLHTKRHIISKIPKPTNKVHILDHFEYYPDKQVIKDTIKNKQIILTFSECQLLSLFFNNRNEILSYQTIYSTIWDLPYLDDRGAVMTLVSKLRKKTGIQRIETIRNVGYRLL